MKFTAKDALLMISPPSTKSDSQKLPELLAELRDLIQAKSITKRGPGEPDFVLASGMTARFYCDTKKVTLSPEGSRLIGEILFALIKDNAEAIGGLELGATFIATAVTVVSAQHGTPIYGFTVRNKQKSYGTQEGAAESFHPDGRRLLCPNRRVAVIEDVVTKGGSILRAVDFVQANQCDIVAVISLVDRNEGGGDLLLQKKLPYFPLFIANESGDLAVNDRLLTHPPQP